MRPQDPVLEALWAQVVSNWQDDAAHHKFLEYCRASELLDQAALRYRGLSGEPTRAPGAEKRLGAVLLLALAKLERSPSPPETTAAGASKLLWILFFLLGSLALLAYLMRT